MPPPLGLLFAGLGVGFAGLAYASASADAPWWRWMIAAVAALFALWFAQTAWRILRHR